MGSQLMVSVEAEIICTGDVEQTRASTPRIVSRATRRLTDDRRSSVRRRVARLTILGVLALVCSTSPVQMISASTETISWLPIARGVEYALMPFSSSGRQRGQLVVARIEPSAVL